MGAIRSRPAEVGSLLLFLVCAVVALHNVARADDLAPAIFRGDKGARMDEWDYINPDTHSNEDSWAPEKSDGVPPGTMTKPETTRSTFWERAFSERFGVWRIDSVDSARLEFKIGNVPDRLSPKAVIVQVTWFRTGDDNPSVDVLDGDTGDAFEIPEILPETTDLGGGWKHTRFHFWSKHCPSFETVRIGPPENGVAYIDQVVIDARCVPLFGGDGDGEEEEEEEEPPSSDGDSSEDELGFFVPFGLGVAAGVLLACVLLALRRRT